ncbi:hypothetical protein EOT10_17040 [Streptomyces antnestii]|uniref:Uncharacterized protein n=1 Tax=Streptomyces antnestii TaxID=2494256 RepID=A0A437PNB0_9ACTN|nr:hypothetical protein [Streptomyces sp. San01]RVU23770.1 hypothetical protein EOT10_17040 [Streptomyces sp. San01]
MSAAEQPHGSPSTLLPLVSRRSLLAGAVGRRDCGPSGQHLAAQHTLTDLTDIEVTAPTSWFDPGRHTLTAEADTPSGPASQSIPVTTVRPAPLAGRTVLDGGRLFGMSTELPEGAPSGDALPASQPGFDEPRMAEALVPGSFGAVRDKWNNANGALAVYPRTAKLAAPASGRRTKRSSLPRPPRPEQPPTSSR